VKTGSGVLIFKKKGDFYIANLKNWYKYKERTILSMDHVREKLYRRVEVEKAKEAMRLVQVMGFPGKDAIARTVSAGDITGLSIVKEDVIRGFNIYGNPIASIKGKSKHQMIGRKHETADEIRTKEEQTLYSDVIKIGDHQFLVSVAKPLGLILTSKIEDRKAMTLGMVLCEHIDTLLSRNFKTKRISTDCDPSFQSLVSRIAGTRIDVGGAGNHNNEIDIKIQNLKDSIRSVNADLQFNLADDHVPYLVTFCTGRRNSLRGNDGLEHPRTQFLDMKPRNDKEMALAFGDYCEVKEMSNKSNNALQPRTISCIALSPCNNTHGSWYFWSIDTEEVINRSNYTYIPIYPKLIIDKMNQYAARKNEIKMGTVKLDMIEKQVYDDKPNNIAIGQITNDECNKIAEAFNKNVMKEEEVSTEVLRVNKDGKHEDDAKSEEEVYQEDDHDDDLLFEEEVHKEENLIVEGDRKRVPARRYVENNSMLDKYVNSISVNNVEDLMINHISYNKCINKYGKITKEAMVKELKQMYDMKVWSYGDFKNKKIMRSLLLLTEKFDAMGTFQKLKGRLVADGSTQEEKPYVETASPTVSLAAINSQLKIAAVEGRIMWVADVVGAYLNAIMKSEVYMKLESHVVRLMEDIDPIIKKYKLKDESAIVKLERALYGCKESALLWHECLKEFLLSIGFVQNEFEKCVFNYIKPGINNKQLTISIHVDDLLMTCEDIKILEWFADELTKRFKEIKVQKGDDLTFLGMKMIVDKNKNIMLSMPKYIEELITDIEKEALSPATNKAFELNDEAKLLSDEERKKFHTLVAKLLYLAHRIRADILLAVSNLTTKVTCPTEEDKIKLNRILSYLKKTKDMVMNVTNKGSIELEAFIDSSFGIHPNGRSHTGMVITLGGTPILVKSSKQKINTLNSTEAELVALSDKVPFVVEIYDFLKSQGYKNIKTPVIHQDNQSTIAIVTNNSKQRSKYMKVRKNMIHDLMNDKEINIKYCPTGFMLADVLTKPLQGSLFRRLRNGLLNSSDISNSNIEGKNKELGGALEEIDGIISSEKESEKDKVDDHKGEI
jgi:hypothetical protein